MCFISLSEKKAKARHDSVTPGLRDSRSISLNEDLFARFNFNSGKYVLLSNEHIIICVHIIFMLMLTMLLCSHDYSLTDFRD